MARNIFRIRNIRNEQTRNSNRFLVRFIGLNTVLERARTSPLLGIQGKYQALVGAAQARSPYSGSSNEAQKIADTLELSILSSNLPDAQIETQAIHRFNDSVKAPTKFAEQEDIQMVFYDYVNGSATAALHIWKGLVADKFTGAMGFKQDFILEEAEFLKYGPEAPAYDEDDLPAGYDEIPYLEKWKIANIYPKQIDLGEHSYENGEARKVTVTFSVDTIYPVDFAYYDQESRLPINNPANVEAFRGLF